MSDEGEQAILVAISGLRDGFAAFRNEHAQTRTEIMGRLDRLQHRMDSLNERCSG